jgi:hypothetical protein
MGGHIAHLAGALFGFIFIKLFQMGGFSKIVVDVLDFLLNLFRKRSFTFKKSPQKNYGKPVVKVSFKNYKG